MAVDKLVDSTVLDAALGAIADVIRNKTGISGTFDFPSPNDLADAIDFYLMMPTGTKSITENGTGIDVASYSKVDVNVSGGGGIYFSVGAGDWDTTVNKPACNLAGSNPNQRRSIWTTDGDTEVYYVASNGKMLSMLHLIPIPTGATQVSVTIDKSIQCAVREFIESGGSIVNSVATTGWENITANTKKTVTLTTGTSYLVVSFRASANNDNFSSTTNPTSISVEFS